MGSTSVNLFLFTMHSKNSVFDPYFLIDTYLMRKTLARIIREIKLQFFFKEKTSFSLKLLLDHFYGQSFIKTVRGPL